MMTDHVPSYQSILPSSILNHAYWYWALVLAMCCFMMTDHVPSFHIILNRPFSIIYIPSTKCICIYVYIFMYIWKNPIPNTQYTKRISKDPVSANILPQYWPSVRCCCSHDFDHDGHNIRKNESRSVSSSRFCCSTPGVTATGGRFCSTWMTMTQGMDTLTFKWYRQLNTFT